MKKTIIVFTCMLFQLCVHAQLKVTADGKTYIQHEYTDGLSSLSVGESNLIEYDYLDDMAIHAHKYGTIQSKNAIAVYGEAVKSTTTGNPVGIYGLGWGPLYTPSYGVVGTIPIGYIGAGVTGTTEGAEPPGGSVNGSYAGFFYGDTYVDGYLTTTCGLYNLSDMRLKTNVVPLSNVSEEKGSVVEKLANLEVIEYNLKSPYQREETTSKCKRRGPGAEIAEKRAKERADRRHYGVSAQELLKLYPDLVAEGQDGYLTVNYTEMVPILLRCIQELKAETEELKAEVEQLRSSEEEPRKARRQDAPEEEDLPDLAASVVLK